MEVNNLSAASRAQRFPSINEGDGSLFALPHPDSGRGGRGPTPPSALAMGAKNPCVEKQSPSAAPLRTACRFYLSSTTIEDKRGDGLLSTQ